MEQHYTNLFELVEFLKDEATAVKHLEELRWKGNRACPHCGNVKTYALKSGKYKCADKDCDEQFTVKVGTIFEGSKVPLKKWFIAIYLLTSHKKGVSSHQLARDLKVTQKTAWFMLHRLRFAFSNGSFQLLGDDKIVELDETFVGGKNKNRHLNKKVKNSQGRSFKDKTPVLGMLERNGLLTAKVVENTSAKVMQPIIIENVKSKSIIMTDEWGGYNKLERIFSHSFVNHGAGQYVIGNVHTNSIEGFWSQLKRSIFGIYHSASRVHLQKYVDESVFRYNTRKVGEGERMEMMLSLANCRLKYHTLIRK
ncbi:IS1595 family transposase [Pedobacter frigidisoli]|uniref:IS1595 family transposase n=1 Tax=Pedobacter frigidisoli TaxID=2530455 RepID=A0A4R0P446_9SPHI|nr:IS1595 family transposase [Pedobacter frigidisoli]TCD11634.1 IS1595 family transposase [Pedobacter frigidisoli]